MKIKFISAILMLGAFNAVCQSATAADRAPLSQTHAAQSGFFDEVRQRWRVDVQSSTSLANQTLNVWLPLYEGIKFENGAIKYGGVSFQNGRIYYGERQIYDGKNIDDFSKYFNEDWNQPQNSIGFNLKEDALSKLTFMFPSKTQITGPEVVLLSGVVSFLKKKKDLASVNWEEETQQLFDAIKTDLGKSVVENTQKASSSADIGQFTELFTGKKNWLPSILNNNDIRTLLCLYSVEGEQGFSPDFWLQSYDYRDSLSISMALRDIVPVFEGEFGKANLQVESGREVELTPSAKLVYSLASILGIDGSTPREGEQFYALHDNLYTHGEAKSYARKFQGLLSLGWGTGMIDRIKNYCDNNRLSLNQFIYNVIKGVTSKNQEEKKYLNDILSQINEGIKNNFQSRRLKLIRKINLEYEAFTQLSAIEQAQAAIKAAQQTISQAEQKLPKIYEQLDLVDLAGKVRRRKQQQEQLAMQQQNTKEIATQTDSAQEPTQ